MAMNFSDRANCCPNGLTRKLLEIMHTKETNLCVAVDDSDCNKILEISDQLGSQIAILKLHCDLIANFSLDFVCQLKALSEKHKFLLFEDR